MFGFKKTLPLLLAFVAIFAFSLAGARASNTQTSATKTTQTTNTKTTKTKQAPATKTTSTDAHNATPGKSAAKPGQHAASHTTKSHALASAEDLTGTISLVSPADKTLTLLGANGVPYDFQVTKKTQVELGDKSIAANELASEEHEQATIHFVPTSRGNLAESIRISAS